jgi:SpoVK/Ycf46/Vps4 family AAA+-type ATPase
MAEVLSKWLGESDKQLDLFFDEVNQLADETFTAPDGTIYELPLLAICEECDGLARARGDDAIYDRIQTTLLQRLDTTCQELKNKLVIFLFTTNVPHVVDPAFLRRAGGTTERFGRLNRRSFLAVLNKHLRGLPFQSDNGHPQTELERQAATDLAGWLFSPNGPDKGLVELTYVGSSHPVLKYRRDFLTGGLLDRAIQEAAVEARRAELEGTGRVGLASALLLTALDRQVRAVVDQLHIHNVTNYFDLPDGVRVASIRRIDQPAVLPLELERTS